MTSTELQRAIAGGRSAAELVHTSARLPSLQVRLVEQRVPYGQLTAAITAVTDALTRRLLELFADHSPAAPPFTWLACGSQARGEQTVLSDQDNALLLGDELSGEGHVASVALHVNDALAACGFPLCNGGVMASNPRWRQPASGWRRDFDAWIDRPSPHALMHFSIFFDMRAVAGDAAGVAALREHVRDRAHRNDIFLSLLTANAVQAKPPVGVLGQLVVSRRGEHAGTLDVKKGAIMPIVDLARVHALAAGSTALATVDRLREAAGGRGLSAQGAAELVGAFELAGSLRARHQARLIERGQPLDNLLHPDELEPTELQELKTVFRLVRRHQRVLTKRRAP